MSLSTFPNKFSTASKAPRRGNASRNKFTTIRLPFESFKPAKKRTIRSGSDETSIPQFQGKDCRFIGFRFKSSSNPGAIRAKGKGSKMCSFYLGLSYIKLFRTQPEPEFVFLSDARIPPVVQPGQVRHDLHQLLSGESSSPGDGRVLLNDKALQQISSDKSARSPEETFYKYCGEEVRFLPVQRDACLAVSYAATRLTFKHLFFLLPRLLKYRY